MSVIARMSAVMRHRGPDDDGHFVEGPLALGFRRLSILDLTAAGHQPMVSEDRRFVLVFNGEIFNYLELRQELVSLGHTFRSSGDTEVLLAAYMQWGRECLPRLNGMWAFLVYDRQRRVLFGSRDRFGVKPLYRCRASGAMLFASEIKGIISSRLYKPETNWSTAARFLAAQHLDDSDATFYRDVWKVPAGSAFELGLDGRLEEWRYWTLPDAASSVDDPPARFADLFEDSVRLRMRSDVPVGVSLSGGLDSTSILCSMARQRPASGAEPLWAFAYMTPEHDESAYIADTVAQTRARLVRLDSDPRSLAERIAQVLWYHDEPVHSMTALIGYEVMRAAAASRVKVMLVGQGADETLGGYPSYFRNLWVTLLLQGRVADARRHVRDYCSVHGGDERQVFMDAMVRAAKSRFRAFAPYRRMAARAHGRAPKPPWFTDALLANLGEEEPLADERLDGALRRSVQREPLPVYLRVEDRNSMAHSIEARLPFMDFRLVSLAFQLPPTWKLNGAWNKYVLRRAMESRIPESVRMRADKMGFPFPARQWAQGGLAQVLLEMLNTQAMRERGIYNLENIQADVRRADAHPEMLNRLFDIAQFETWCALGSGAAENASA